MDAEELAREIVEGVLQLDEAQQSADAPQLLTIEMLQAHGRVGAGLSEWQDAPAEELVVLLAIAAVRRILPRLEGASSSYEIAERTVAAAEQWADRRTPREADLAEVAANAAVTEGLALWNNDRRAGWAVRSAAWCAMAPKYRWAAIAALVGATRATSPSDVVDSLKECLSANRRS